ncbi:MAG TPA: hypothetical protein VFF14_02255 [Candidatus Deferrimicrobium sp.]|nr:hypothetical protein [Candidatus Deferrimicrobium sp.]
MKLNLRTISNGSFLIFLGVVGLLINYGVIGLGFIGAFIDFWPVVLIVLGLGLVFNRRVPASLAFLVLGIVMVVASFYAPISTRHSFPLGINWNQNSGETINLPINYPLDKNVTKAKVSINGGGSIINISDTEEGFAKGEITSTGGNPKVEYNQAKGSMTINANWNNRVSRGDNYDLKFTKEIPLELNINAGAISGKLDFSKLKLSSLEMNSGASDTRLVFGANGMNSKVRISSAASKLELAIPQDVGVKLRYNGLPIGGVDINNGAVFNQNSNTYTTDNFSSAMSTLEIEVSGAATKVEIVKP